MNGNNAIFNKKDKILETTTDNSRLKYGNDLLRLL